MRIAIAGTRGIPARYGGFETFAEQLSERLAKRGHEVTVYCRSHLFKGEDGGSSPADTAKQNSAPCKEVRRVLLPSIRSKHLETLSHTFFSVLHIIWWRIVQPRSAPQVVILCNGANAPFIPLLSLFGRKVLLNVDGIERKRRKWGKAGALWYRFGEWCAIKFPDVVISDAAVIADYYRSSYGTISEVVTYGHDDSRKKQVEEKLLGRFPSEISNTLVKFDLRPGGYILYVSRLEPENNCHVALRAYRELFPEDSKSEIELVIVGNAPYADSYIESLRTDAGPGVKFLGFQFGDTYRDLMLGAQAYIQATEVGGTHPALVEAMGFGNIVFANHTPENAEVLGSTGYLYRTSSELAAALGKVLSQGGLELLRRSALRRAEDTYNWNSIVQQYEELSDRVLYAQL